jgi:hypothetical protein
VSAHPRGIDLNPDNIDRPVRGDTWPNSRPVPRWDALSLVVEPTDPGDGFVQVWMSDGQGEPGIHLTQAQCHTLALSLMSRALIMSEGNPSWIMNEEDES